MKRPADSPTPKALALACVVWLFVTCVASANDKLLAQERWRERSHGVSLRPPLGSSMHELAADEALVRIEGEPGYVIKVSVKQSKSDLEMGLVRRTAIEQLATVYPSASIVAERELRPAGRPGAMIYFKFTDNRKRTWVMGQAFMQLDPRTLVVLQLDAAWEQERTTRAIFEAVVGSLEVEDPRALDERNAALIQAGAQWYQTIDPRQLHPRTHDEPERWFRIVAGKDEVGFMRLGRRSETAMDRPGVRVDVQARLHLGDQVYDTLSNFFLSDDRTQEFWSIKTTARPLKPPANASAGGPPNPSWVETGVRDRDAITVSRQDPAARKPDEKWHKPPTGYLSQAELYLIPPLLAAAPDGELGFYAYYPVAGKILLRTEKVQRTGPGEPGVVKLIERPGPDLPEQISFYDAAGNLLRRQLPDGRLMLPATPQEIQSRWKLR